MARSEHELVELRASLVRRTVAGRTEEIRFPDGVAEIAPATAVAAAAAALRNALSSSTDRRRSFALHVSDRWLRPLILPPIKAALTEGELGRVIEREMQVAYADSTEAWTIRHVTQLDGSILAVACPNPLCSPQVPAGGNCRAVMPLTLELAAQGNLGAHPTWFLLVDGAVSSVLLWQDKAVAQWRVSFLADASSDGVAEAFMRVVAQTGALCRRVEMVMLGAEEAFVSRGAEALRKQGWQVAGGSRP